MWAELEWMRMPRQGLGKDLRRPSVCTSGWSSDPSTNIKPEITGENNNPLEGESDFQSYPIIRFKCPVQEKKNHKVYKETGKFGPLKGKKSMNRNYPWRRHDARSNT